MNLEEEKLHANHHSQTISQQLNKTNLKLAVDNKGQTIPED
jgi:hypothetical protein